MKQIIATDVEKCHGCASCICVCPVGEANIISVVDDKLRISVDSQKCIACGACLRACPYNARYYNDDTERFVDDLKKGEPIALIVAPSFSTIFPNWKAILAWFKTQGVSVIVDVTLGIEICTWAHLRYIEQYNNAALITQPCPPIVSYIEKYHPALLRRLSPVFSPILCTSIYLKKVLKLPEKIAAMTPCPAKADEFIKLNSVSYNVTFKKLADYLIAHDISIPEADFEFDNVAVVPGRVQVIPSSLPENIKRAIGCISFDDSQIRVEVIKDRGKYRYLDLLLREEIRSLPVLFDALNCKGGCCNGIGGSIEKPDSQCMIHIQNEDAKKNNSEQMYLFAVFDDRLLLNDYLAWHPDE